jgi:hypothetical protein
LFFFYFLFQPVTAVVLFFIPPRF